MHIQRKYLLLGLVFLSAALCFTAFVAFIIFNTSPQPFSSLPVDKPVALKDIPTTPPSEPQPLYMTTMTHMEGGWKDNENEFLFTKHVSQLRHGATLAAQYGAILTVETESEFAEANSTWGINIMQELLDMGMGVNTHCDIGLVGQYGSRAKDMYSYADAVTDMSYNKQLVDALVGAKNNLACSGGSGYFDWIQAFLDVGFAYKNSLVGANMLAIPYENRPDNGLWTDTYIAEGGGFHESVPADLMDRIYLMRLKNLDDFVHDPDGTLVISNGALGSIQALAESYGSQRATCGPKCTLTTEDIDVLVQTIRDVDAKRDTSQIAKLNLYIAVDYLGESYAEVLEYFFAEMQKLSDEGVITWASQSDVYDHYVDLVPVQ